VNSTPTTAHYSHESFSATTPTSFASPNFAYTHGGSHAFVPARSMSFGQIEGISQHYSYQGVQFGNQETQAGYPIPSHPPYAQPAPPHQVLGSMPHTNTAPESVPRTWNAAPTVPAPMSASGQYPQHVPNSYYPQHPPVEAYESRPNATYQQQAQYYPAASNPG
jgi:hypothetical protein